MKRLLAVAIGVIIIVTAVGLFFFWWIQGPSEEEVTSSSPTAEEDVEAVSQPDLEPVVVEKPFLRTDNALSVTQSSATLAGFVDPKGSTITVWFEYGEKPSLDLQSREVTVSSQEDIIMEIKNLQPDTKYLFRVVGESPEGTFRGKTRTFMTDF